MAIVLTVNGQQIGLDEDLYWADEYSWSPVLQTVDFAADGAVLIDEWERQAGRPITLRPYDDTSAHMPSAVLRQLQALASVPELEMTLQIRATTFSVMWRRTDGPAIEAEPLTFMSDAQPGDVGDQFLVTLRFIEI